MLRRFLMLTLLATLTACGGGGGDQIDMSSPDPKNSTGFVNGKPRHATAKVGRPYYVRGRRYVPNYDPDYSETGEASWYGPGFDGRSTANGERFDQHALTAAHRTLPMPSMVRVTNLANGKSAKVRVNDRGPFAENRVIDLSKAAAEEIDMIRTGVARVKVEYLPDETEYVLSQLERGKRPAEIDRDMREHPVQMASNDWFGEKSNPRVEVSQETVAAANTSDVSASDLPPPPAQMAKTAAASKKQKRSPFDFISDAMADEALPKPTAPVVRMAPPEVSDPNEKGRLHVQLGAFGNYENAEKLARQFEGARIDGTESGQMKLYRVRLGPFADRYSAESMLAQVQSTLPDAQLITW